MAQLSDGMSHSKIKSMLGFLVGVKEVEEL